MEPQGFQEPYQFVHPYFSTTMFPISHREPDTEVTLGDGTTVLWHIEVADFYWAVMEQRETDRIKFCNDNDIDPERFRGCHGCDMTGYHHINHLPCWCSWGSTRLKLGQEKKR